MGAPLTYRRLRAPDKDGEVLVSPSWDICRRQLEQASTMATSVFGRSMDDWRYRAREHLLLAARRYTGQYLDVPGQVDEDLVRRPIIVTGHQPQLFHPGVWAKNFATSAMAQQLGGTAIHVVIDNDVLTRPSLRVPMGSYRSPSITNESYDRFMDPLPYENRYVRDLEMFQSFAKRVAQRVKPFVNDPLINDLWPQIRNDVRAGDAIGAAFAKSRHRLERLWGQQTLEVPLSQLCQSETFLLFVFGLLFDIKAVHTAHNARLAEYRKVHKLRSLAQPIPDLRMREDWFECPFWVWSPERPERKPLWCRHVGSDLELSDGIHQWYLSSVLGNLQAAVSQWSDFCAESLSVRPRALTNTLFLRLFVGDLFVHGIGGAKYDQITDALISDLFGLEPPPMVALSQTTLLPNMPASTKQGELNAAHQLRRQMYHHPERFLDTEQKNNPKVSCIVKRKNKLIHLELPKGHRKERHLAICEVNVELRRLLLEKAEKQAVAMEDLMQRQKVEQVLGSREWSYAIFPGDFLRARLVELQLNTA